MSDKKDFPLPIPSSVGKAIGSISGGVLGYQAGKALFEFSGAPSRLTDNDHNTLTGDRQLATDEIENSSLENEAFYSNAVAGELSGLVCASAIGAVAGYNLGATNPNKSILVGLGAVAAAYGYHQLHNKIDSLQNNDSTDNLETTISSDIDMS